MDYVCFGARRSTARDVCDFVIAYTGDLRQLEHDYLHAAVALKLAMNAFDLMDAKKKSQAPKDGADQPEQALSGDSGPVRPEEAGT